MARYAHSAGLPKLVPTIGTFTEVIDGQTGAARTDLESLYGRLSVAAPVRHPTNSLLRSSSWRGLTHEGVDSRGYEVPFRFTMRNLQPRVFSPRGRHPATE